MDYYYFPTSHWSRVISVMLAEKGLEPTRHFVDIRENATFEPAYMALNPKGVVPTLVDGGATVCNSPRIARYLDGLGGPPLYQRLNNDDVLAWVRRLEQVPMMLLSYSVWTKGGKGERSADILLDKVERAARYAGEHPELAPLFERKRAYFEDFRSQVYDPATVARETQGMSALLDEMGVILKTNDWIGGDRYSFADCIATAILYRLIDLELCDHWHGDADHGVHAYYERLCARPSFRAVFVDDPLIP